MANIGDALSEILSKLAQLLGLKHSEQHKLEQAEHTAVAAKARNADRLDALKDKIKSLEAQILRKKQELDASRGDSKRIIAGNIEQLFRELDLLQGQERIARANVERASIFLAKLQEKKVSQEAGLEEGQLDDLALDLQEIFAGTKAMDREASDLEKVTYESAARSHIDVDRRMAEVQGETPTATGLSPDIEKRLRQLEADEG